MTNLELTVIHTAIRLARERCDATPGSTHSDMEFITIANIENLLTVVNSTPSEQLPALMGSLREWQWHIPTEEQS